VARIPANRASIIMLFEIVVTALSAWLLAGETPGPREWAGGACIVLASALSSWVHRTRATPDTGGHPEATLDVDLETARGSGHKPERQDGSRAMV
jgi:hypothetical protein